MRTPITPDLMKLPDARFLACDEPPLNVVIPRRTFEKLKSLIAREGL